MSTDRVITMKKTFRLKLEEEDVDRAVKLFDKILIELGDTKTKVTKSYVVQKLIDRFIELDGN